MMEFHPVSDIFPMMHREAFEELTEDIKLNGLLIPIVIYEDKVLDGRNRLKACDKLGIEPRFTAYDGDDPLAYVVSQNLSRRHLDESQRAMVAARIANLKEGRPKKNAPIGGVSTAHAAKRLSVGPRSLERAKKVLRDGTKGLVRAVEDGNIAVSIAAKLADQDRATQDEAVDQPDKAAHIVKQKTREGHEAALATQIKGLPTKKYGLVLADPEWKFAVWSEETGNDRAAANHFATSALEQIKARDVPSIAADNCVLGLWATTPMLEQALEVMAAWGFEYRSHCIWLKDKVGTGYWFRSVHELLLIGVKGDVPAPAPGTQFESAWDADVAEHSAKPHFAYEIFERYFPNIPKIELNARKKRDGWDCWGAEAPLDPEADIPTERTRA
jgi:N6-adenosine-specific RNA methylase IME4